MLVVEGTPEHVAATSASHTGRYLAQVLEQAKKPPQGHRAAANQRRNART